MAAARADTLIELTERVGFAAPIAERRSSRRRHGVELFATLALAVSLMIAATAVSIGVARAQLAPYLPSAASAAGSRRAETYSPLIPAALMIGHHLSTSAL